MILRTAGFNELGPQTLYGVLRLRVEVFVAEQQSAYVDLDRRDLEAGARHCWIEKQGEILAYLRVLSPPEGGSEIGRVVTAPSARRQGLGDRLMVHAIALARRPITLNAQQYLQAWYERLGFAVSGPVFTFDGDSIVHVPMVLR